ALPGGPREAAVSAPETAAPRSGCLARFMTGGHRDRDRRPDARFGIDLQLGPRVLAQRLYDQSAQLARNRPRHSFRESDAVIGDDDAVMAILLAQTFEQDGAAF